mgnify:FL=1
MDMTAVTTLISTVGFPIACCCVMFYQNSQLQKTLSELTVTLEKMNERIGHIEDKVNETSGN